MAGQHADAFEANSGQRPLPAFPGFAFDRHVPHHLATLLRLADDTPVLLRPIAPGVARYLPGAATDFSRSKARLTYHPVSSAPPPLT